MTSYIQGRWNSLGNGDRDLLDFGRSKIKALSFKSPMTIDYYSPLLISGPSYGSAYKNTCKDLTFKSTSFSNHYFRPCATSFPSPLHLFMQLGQVLREDLKIGMFYIKAVYQNNLDWSDDRAATRNSKQEIPQHPKV